MVSYPPPDGVSASPAPVSRPERPILYTAEDRCAMEHPEDGVTGVAMALAAVSGLQEDELPAFFQALRQSMQSDLWKLLTEDAPYG